MRNRSLVSLVCLAAALLACSAANQPKVLTSPALAPSASQQPASSASQQPASSAKPAALPQPSSSSKAAQPEGLAVEQSAPAGVFPLNDAEAAEAEQKCKPLQDSLTKTGQAAKRSGASPVDAMIEALKDPVKIPGIDVARCAELIGRDLRVYRANLVEAQAKKVLKILALTLASASERFPAQICQSAGPVPASLEQVRTASFQSDASSWAAPGWKCLGFSLTGAPQAFQYEFSTDLPSASWEVVARGFSSQGHPATELYIRGVIENGKIIPSSSIMRRR